MSTVSVLKAMERERRPATVVNVPAPSLSTLRRRSLPFWADIWGSPWERHDAVWMDGWPGGMSQTVGERGSPDPLVAYSRRTGFDTYVGSVTARKRAMPWIGLAVGIAAGFGELVAQVDQAVARERERLVVQRGAQRRP